MSNMLRNGLVAMSMFITSLAFSTGTGPFYVVVGTFSDEDQAKEFATSIDALFPDASYTFDPERKVYYAYVSERPLLQQAEAVRQDVQQQSGFGQAWIFTDFRFGGVMGPGMIASEGYTTLELYTGGSVLLGSSDNAYLAFSSPTPDVNVKDEHTFVRTMRFTAETTSGVGLSGKVFLVDKEGRAVSEFKTGQDVSFSGKEPRQTVTLLCKVAGYNADIKMIDLAGLAALKGVERNSEGVWEVRFKLSKSEPDKVKLLYHDVFYPDAAVFRQASRQQIDALATLLEANPDWNIVINSHCNAGPKRHIKVTRLSYFNLKDAADKSGTDKELTKERALTLRDYLVYQGIDKSRITVMGWGSLDRLVKQGEDVAKVNERLEVDILR